MVSLEVVPEYWRAVLTSNVDLDVSLVYSTNKHGCGYWTGSPVGYPYYKVL